MFTPTCFASRPIVIVGMSRLSRSMCTQRRPWTLVPSQSLEPQADTCDQTRVVSITTSGACSVGVVAPEPLVHEPDVGRDFAANLVAKPKRSLAVRQSGALTAARIRLAVPIELDLRLQDQPLSDQQVVVG